MTVLSFNFKMKIAYKICESGLSQNNLGSRPYWPALGV